MVTEETRPEQPEPGFNWHSPGQGAHFYLSTPELSQRLDLLQHLTANSDRIALVTGPEGIGKTSLLKRFQALAADHWKLCRIDANAMMQPEQLFTALAGCFSLPAGDERPIDQLPRHFEELRQTGHLPVILIDDAQLLPLPTIISLFRLYELRPTAQALVRLILFATPQFDDLLATPQVMAMNLQALQVMQMPPLSAKQTEQLARQRMAAEGLTGGELSDGQLTKIYNDTAGFPGEIVKRIGRLSKRLDKSRPAKGAPGRRPWTMLAGGVLIGLPLLLVLVYQERINALFSGDGRTPESISLAPVRRDPVIPLQLPTVDGGKPAEAPALIRAGEGMPELSLPEVSQTQRQKEASAEDVEALPSVAEAPPRQPNATDVKLREPSRPSSPNDTRVSSTLPSLAESPLWTASDGVVGDMSAVPVTKTPVTERKLPEPQLSLPATDVVGENTPMADLTLPRRREREGRSAEAQELAPESPEPPQTLAAAAESPVPVVAPPELENPRSSGAAAEVATLDKTATQARPQMVEKDLPARPPDSKPRRESWLLQQKPSAYTLQLLGVQEEEAVHRFLRRHRLQGETAYFRTLRNNRPWFSLVYGVYPDRAAAVAARYKLPSGLGKSGVWPRSLASIHEAIGTD